MARLVIVDGPMVGAQFPVDDMVLVGRDPRCGVVLGHREVSAHHARLLRAGDGYLLEDLQSRNGTLLNDRPVTRIRLADGDRIQIGRTTLRYEAGAKAPVSGAPEEELRTVTMEIDATTDLLKLEGIQSPAKVRRLGQHLKLLIDLSRTLGAVQGLKTTLDQITELLLQFFPQAVNAMILLAQGDQLTPMAVRWREKSPHNSAHIYSETIVRKALTEKRSFLTVDALRDDRFSHSRSVVELNLRSVMCAPILFKEKALGVLELDTVASPQMFMEDDLNLFTAIATQVGASIANGRLYDELQGLTFNITSSLTTALDLRSSWFKGHSEGVARVALPLARRLEVDGQMLEDLRLAALLHDVGMLSVPDHILEKEEPLTADELAIYRQHPLRSVEILEPIRQFHDVLPMVRSHHEAFDGSGYPEGLRGTQIPLGSRIVAVANAFDSLTTGRPGKPALDHLAALAEIQGLSGKEFDPQVVEPLGRMVESWSRTRERRAGVPRT